MENQHEISGLIIKSPWIEKILSGEKVWEIRGTATKKRGWIALIKSGSKKIFGVCRLIDVVGPLSLEEMLNTVDNHLVPLEELKKDGLPYSKTFAWVLDRPVTLEKPLPYSHPSGAITWVSLPSSPEISDAIKSTIIFYKSPIDDVRQSFLDSLAKDLRIIGHEVSVKKSEKSLDLEFYGLDFSSISETDIRDKHRHIRNRSLQKDAKFFEEMESWGIDNLFINGTDLEIEKIKPEVRICQSREEKNIYRYVRSLQTVSNSSGC